MYYNRTIDREFAKCLMEGGQLRWLFNYVKNHSDLDFLIGRNKNQQWISIYRGLTRIMRIRPTRDSALVNVDAANVYQNLLPDSFGVKSISGLSEESIKRIREYLVNKGKKDRYYGNMKEGYYQNMFSRNHGISSSKDSDFVIIDKEVVVGYRNEDSKGQIFSPLQKSYRDLQSKISKRNPKRYGRDLTKKSLGNELDFLAINKSGDLLLIEFKHGYSTAGIYLSPLQIGLYFEIFNSPLLGRELNESVEAMLGQKQGLGLVNPNWGSPKLSGKIIPVLVIAIPNYRTSAQEKFYEILEICREEKGKNFLGDLRTYEYTAQGDLVAWN